MLDWMDLPKQNKALPVEVATGGTPSEMPRRMKLSRLRLSLPKDDKYVAYHKGFKARRTSTWIEWGGISKLVCGCAAA